MSSNQGREASVSISPGQSAMTSLSVGEVGGAPLAGDGADGGDLRDLRRDVQPGAEALVLGAALVDGARASRRRARRRRRGWSAAAREAAGDALVELVERPERAGDDDQPAAGTQAGREGAQHVGRREVVGLGDGVDLVGGVGVRAHACRGVGEDDVDLAQLGGERRDGVAVADVEHAALDASDRRPGGDVGRGGPDALRVAAGEQDAVAAARMPGGQRLRRARGRAPGWRR